MISTPKRGRPWPPDHEKAESQIILRVKTRRKAAYVRAANRQNQTLAAFVTETCDAASGYVDETSTQPKPTK